MDQAAASYGITKARETSAQIEALVLTWDWKMNKNKLLIENFFESTYFVHSNGNFLYPLDASSTDLKMLSDLKNTTE